MELKDILTQYRKTYCIHWKGWCKTEAWVYWSSDEKRLLIGKVPDSGKDWRQKRASEDEMLDTPLILRTWTWANSGKWWRTGKPGELQCMGWQRVGRGWKTEQQQENFNILKLLSEKSHIHGFKYLWVRKKLCTLWFQFRRIYGIYGGTIIYLI